MKWLTACLLLLFIFAVHSEEQPIVKMQTNFGLIVLKLNPEKAPKTVNNFLRYAQDGFYDGTLFHRLIKNFIIQGGRYTQDYEKKEPTYAPIPNESDNGLKNLSGTIAMARNMYEPNSATSQFFFNIKNNAFLNYQQEKWGYTVFGSVIKGINVINKMNNVKTGAKAHLKKQVPERPIIIEKVIVENVPVRQTVEFIKAKVIIKSETQEEVSLPKEITSKTTNSISKRLPPDPPSEPDKREPLPE
jgi:cyclophilin family peptidyl-prolyl cis-trans isomerase